MAKKSEGRIHAATLFTLSLLQVTIACFFAITRN